jgi:hypothetical protein
LDVHGFTELLGDAADVVRVYDARMVVVEEVEDLVDAVLNYSQTYSAILVA